jgi:hypothetical protein
MPRSLLIFAAALVWAAPPILPPRIGDFHQTGTAPYSAPDSASFREYGLEVAERAEYAAGDRKLEITLLRAKDATGAFGMYQWLRPRDAKPAEPEQGERSVQKGDLVLFQYGNYVFTLRGAMPEQEHLDALLSILPRYERTPPPPVLRHLPSEGLVPHSGRFIQGPVVLERLAPAIPPSAVAFHLGAEGEWVEYQAEGGRLNLLLFYYPTPQMARAQLEEFQKIPGLITKRSGPLIAAVVKPFSRDEAEKLLARVRYEANITWSQRPQVQDDNVGEFLIGVILLCLILIGFAILAGIGVGGVRLLLNRVFPNSRFSSASEAPIIRLKLSDQ